MANGIVFGPWSGGITESSAVIKAAIENRRGVRLVLSRDPALGSPTIVPPTETNTSEITVIAFRPAGLPANTPFHYALEIDGVIVEESRGRFRTFPSADSPTSFMFVCSGDAQTGSDNEVFDAIRREDPLFFLHLGDLHYGDVNSTLLHKYREKYREVLASATQAALYRNVPLAYVWDDHDYVANNTHRTSPGRLQARLTYQECVPHYPLVEGAGDVAIYQAFTVGRVRFLLTDTRSERDPQDDAGFDKTMLGSRQKEWLKRELLEGRDRGGLTVWVNSVPWIGLRKEKEDEWFGYPEERDELGQFITSNGIRNVCMLSADAHMLAIDDGSNNKPPTGNGGFPVFHASPLDRHRSDKGGPYSHGVFPKSSGQYGVFRVHDDGREGVQVEWIGKRVGADAPILSFSFNSRR
jgi:phosphodiesterase/alkaline phosphatase D-like protein